MEQRRSERGCEQHDYRDTIAYSGNAQISVCVSDESRIEQPGQHTDDESAGHSGPPAQDGRQNTQHRNANGGIGTPHGENDSHQQKDQKSCQATGIDRYTLIAGSTARTTLQPDEWRVPRSHTATFQPGVLVAGLRSDYARTATMRSNFYALLTPRTVIFCESLTADHY